MLNPSSCNSFDITGLVPAPKTRPRSLGENLSFTAFMIGETKF